MRSKSVVEIDTDLLINFQKSHRVSSLIGVFPLKLVDNDLMISKPRLICSSFMLTFLLTCISLQLSTPQHESYAKPSYAQQISFYFDYGALNVAIVVRLWSTLRGRKRFLFVLRVLSRTKRSLDGAGISWRPKQTFWTSAIQSVLFMCSNFIDPLTSDGTVFGLANTLSYYFLVLAVIWIYTDFMWFADNLAEGFRGLNSNLPHARTAGDVEFLLKCHYLLTKSSTELDAASSAGLSFTFFSSFFILFFSVHDGIVSVLVGLPLTSTLSSFFWAVLMMILFFRIVNSASHVYYQVYCKH